jgi:nickel-dependent lactate racemase
MWWRVTEMKNSNAQCLRLADSFRVSYGKSFIDVKVSCGADLLSSPSEFFALPDEGVAEALENCVYSESFDECVRQSERVLFIFPDITRKSGLQRFFHRMLETVKKHGKDFSVTFAVGTHRPVTDAEKEEILGASYAACAGRFIEHDCEDLENHAFFGITKLKTPVLINKMYMEHDLIVPVGAVGYHYFAGYGGGRKLVFPGIAAKKSIMRNHMLALDSSSGKRHPMAANGELNRNPVHRDIVDALMIARSDKTFL